MWINIYNIEHVLLRVLLSYYLLPLNQGGNAMKISFCQSIHPSVWHCIRSRWLIVLMLLVLSTSVCCTTMHFKSSRLLAETAKLPLYTIILSQLKTMTTIACSRSFQQDRIWLNGKEEDISCPRLQSCLQESMSLTFRTLTLLSTEWQELSLWH